MLGAHLLVCQMPPKQVWSQHLVVREPPCFLSVMWHGEALYRLGVQGIKILILFGVFSDKLDSSFSARFLIYGAHTVCFCTLVAILDPSHSLFLSEIEVLGYTNLYTFFPTLIHERLLYRGIGHENISKHFHNFMSLHVQRSIIELICSSLRAIFKP
jgi:hypothetical protein